MTLSTDLQFVEWALDALERIEVRALVWGLVDSALSDEEVHQTLNDVLDKHHTHLSLPDCTIATATDLLRCLQDQALLFPVPTRPDAPLRWRTRMAEGLRLLARLRQLFPNRHEGREDWITAPTLVADYRLLWRPRRYPRRDRTVRQALELLEQSIASPALLDSLHHWFGKGGSDWALAGFQVDATARILSDLNAGISRGTLVAAGTGSGKTLAFYLPALTWLAAQKKAAPKSKGVRILALYPRNELLKDQLSEVYAQSRKFDDYFGHSGARRISVGVLYSDTPNTLKVAPRKWGKQSRGAVCPFFRCPREGCHGELRLHREDVQAGVERLRCDQCNSIVDSDALRLTRASMQNDPPDILFTSVEMLNQRMSDSQMRHLFGLGSQAQCAPELVLLDEVHLYSGTYGSQVAHLLRRWSAMTGKRSSFVGLSATIAKGASFFSSLIGMEPNKVEEISPRPEDMQEEGAEYLVALRGDPVSQTALLSTTIQALMLSSRLLDSQHQVGPDRPFSGWRAFAFTDQMDATNRLYYDLLDAEGRNMNGHPATHRYPNGGLAILRHPSPSRRRYEGGQDWRLAVAIGHDLAIRHRISRTTAYDAGVETNSEIVVATAALEVGYDDPGVGLVLQHKAPHDMTQFLQRKGRAGRTRHMRPWTLMVLSEYGRDRVAYQSYDQYFDPELPPRELPLSNRYIRRMQAVYALIDYIGIRMQQGEPSGSPWRDMQGPEQFPAIAHWAPGIQAELSRLAKETEFPIDKVTWISLKQQAHKVAPPGPESDHWQGANWLAYRIRRSYLVKILSQLLRDPLATETFSQHLASALDLPLSEVGPLLWNHPRPLLLTAIPTALRRLATDWRSNDEPQADQTARHPLPEFVPAMLFNDLSLPEVRLEPPGFVLDGDTRYLPVQQALSELAPGKISRRFDAPLWLGLDAVQLQSILDEGQEEAVQKVDIRRWYHLDPQPSFWTVDEGDPLKYNAYRPIAMILTTPPSGAGHPEVLDTSNARLEWRSQLFARHRAFTFDPPSNRVGIANLIEAVHVHTHAAQTPATVRRYAVASLANLRIRRNRETTEQTITWQFNAEGLPCGIGFEMEADALIFTLRFPDHPHSQINWNDPVRIRAARSARYAWEARHGTALSEVEHNPFLRIWLGEIFQTAITLIATRHSVNLRVAIDAVGYGKEMEILLSVLGTVFQSPLPQEDGSTDEGLSERSSDRLRFRLEESLRNRNVLLALRQTALVLIEPIGADWDPWLTTTMKHTLGAALLEALQQTCPQVDPDELTIDVDPGLREDGTIVATDELWISEIHPGGNGLIEQVTEVLAQEPDRFYRHIEMALSPSEFEIIDAQLRDTIQRLGGEDTDDELLDYAQAVRSAITSEGAQHSLSTLRRALVERGHAVFHGYVVALSNRLLRPGTPPALDALLADLFTRWEDLETQHEVEIDARVMCALFSQDQRIDEAFADVQMDLPTEAVREPWRFSALMGIVWARGHALRAGALPLYSRFSNTPAVSERLILETWLTPREEPIDATALQWAGLLHDRLILTGHASVSMPPIGAILGTVVREVVTNPVQLDYLNVYPRLISVRRSHGDIELQFELTEAV